MSLTEVSTYFFQAALLKELHDLVKGKVKLIVYAHDTSRVIECLASLGDQAIR